MPVQAAYAHHVWTFDFVEDATQDGRKLGFLTLTHEHNQRGFCLEVRRGFNADEVLSVRPAFRQRLRVHR